MKHPCASQSSKQATMTFVLATLVFGAGCAPMNFEAIPTPEERKSTPEDPAPTPTTSPTPTPIPTPTPVPPSTATEHFYQDESANKVDILIIADNSGSMEVEQNKMGERFDKFTSAISDIDYQIALTTTDLDSFRFGLDGTIVEWETTKSKILTPSTPRAADIFKKTIQRKETLNCWQPNKPGCPSGDEQPLGAMIRSIEHRYGANNGFFRDKVDLAVIVLSDEDELSDGPARATKPREVIDRFQAAFGKSKNLAVHGIIVVPGDRRCLEMQLEQTRDGMSAHYGTHVTELARLTGGSVKSICDSDYSESLSNISRSVRQLVGTFELHQAPVPGSVKVTLTPSGPAQFRVDGKKLIFDTPPPAGTRIEVTYRY